MHGSFFSCAKVNIINKDGSGKGTTAAEQQMCGRWWREESDQLRRTITSTATTRNEHGRRCLRENKGATDRVRGHRSEEVKCTEGGVVSSGKLRGRRRNGGTVGGGDKAHHRRYTKYAKVRR